MGSMNRKARLVRVVQNCGIALVAAAVIGVSSPAAAFAARATEPSPPTSPETELVVPGGAGLTEEQEAELRAVFAGVSDTSAVFDVAAADIAGASAESVADFAAIVGSAGWTIANDTVTVQASDLAVEIAAEVRACTGYRGYKGFYGAFWQWGLDSCLTDSLIAAVGGGAGGAVAIGGVLAAAGLAPAGALSAAIGGLAGMSAGFLKVCQTASYGARAIYLNAYVTGNVGCWGQ